MRRHLELGLLPLLILVFAWGCSDDPTDPIVENGDPVFNTTTCLGCHSSEEALKASLGPESQLAAAPMPVDDG